MFDVFGLFTQLRASNVSVAASGVQFRLGSSFLPQKLSVEFQGGQNSCVSLFSKIWYKNTLLERDVCQHCVALNTGRRPPF